MLNTVPVATFSGPSQNPLRPIHMPGTAGGVGGVFVGTSSANISVSPSLAWPRLSNWLHVPPP